MASHGFDPERGRARFHFRVFGRQYNRTLPCSSAREAERTEARVEATVADIESGRVSVPAGAKVVDFVMSGGKVAAPRPEPPAIATVGELVARYEAEAPIHLESSTARMIAIHLRRIREVFAESTKLADLDPQSYVNRRAVAEYRGRVIQRKTIEMELQSFRQAWAWAAGRTPGLAPPAWSLKGLSFPKGRAARPFMTWAEIEREAGRSGDVALWDCLWLDRSQVRGLLAHAAAAGGPGFVPPMFAAAAFTGARRSELCRSRVSDWDFDGGSVQVRQKKRDREKEYSLRVIPLHPELRSVMSGWFEVHTGGQHTFAKPGGDPVSWDAARFHFEAALAGSKWSVVRGWHVLRHSFASNLAAEGVDQRLIDGWMGHSTAVRERYRHIRPDRAAEAIARL